MKALFVLWCMFVFFVCQSPIFAETISVAEGYSFVCDGTTCRVGLRVRNGSRNTIYLLVGRKDIIFPLNSGSNPAIVLDYRKNLRDGCSASPESLPESNAIFFQLYPEETKNVEFVFAYEVKGRHNIWTRIRRMLKHDTKTYILAPKYLKIHTVYYLSGFDNVKCRTVESSLWRLCPNMPVEANFTISQEIQAGKEQ